MCDAESKLMKRERKVPLNKKMWKNGSCLPTSAQSLLRSAKGFEMVRLRPSLNLLLTVSWYCLLCGGKEGVVDFSLYTNKNIQIQHYKVRFVLSEDFEYQPSLDRPLNTHQGLIL